MVKHKMTLQMHITLNDTTAHGLLSLYIIIIFLLSTHCPTIKETHSQFKVPTQTTAIHLNATENTIMQTSDSI